MIRKRLSTQKSISGVYKASKYFHKDEGCILFESNIYTSINSTKKEIASTIARSIESDVAIRTKGRKQSVRSQHDMVSFHTDDKVTPAQAKEIVKELYEKTHNLSNRKYALGVHIDTDEVHVHIVWALKAFNGKCYNVSNDYRVIERECEKLEQKYNLITPKNRISRDIEELEKIKSLTAAEKKSIINKKYIDKHLSKNEQMLDVRGIISNKKQLKGILKNFLDNASNPSDFINQITDNGFNIIHNGQSSYSIQHNEQIFKASELNLSYKTLKSKFGEDLEFEKVLAVKHKVVSFSHCEVTIGTQQPDFMKKINPNSILAKKFQFTQHDEKVEYFYNSVKGKKAFEYHKEPSRVSFQDLSRQSAKAGIQRIVADAKPPQSLTVNGPDFFKKNIWLEFQLMRLEAKGFQIEGYRPSPADREELKKLQEYYASMKRNSDSKQKAHAIETPKAHPTLVHLESHEYFKTAEKELIEQDRLFPENHILHEEPTALDKITFIEGDYSTYSIGNLCVELEGVINRLDIKYLIGNSSNDIEGHRHWDSTHKNHVHLKPQIERQQYYLRQNIYKIYDEIKSRDSKLAKELSAELKKSIKYNIRFKLK